MPPRFNSGANVWPTPTQKRRKRERRPRGAGTEVLADALAAAVVEVEAVASLCTAVLDDSATTKGLSAFFGSPTACFAGDESAIVVEVVGSDSTAAVYEGGLSSEDVVFSDSGLVSLTICFQAAPDADDSFGGVTSVFLLVSDPRAPSCLTGALSIFVMGRQALLIVPSGILSLTSLNPGRVGTSLVFAFGAVATVPGGFVGASPVEGFAALSEAAIVR
jgi:hypothetical protein